MFDSEADVHVNEVRQGRARKRLALRLGIVILGFASLGADEAERPVLDKQKLLEAQTFWDNRDWDWYKANIPLFECPDEDINTTYYFRWELVTKHLTYGSPSTGYVFTEFIDRPFWSGTYGAISCPAGHQLYEVRWLRDARFARDYFRYWFRTAGAEPRRYSTWLADAIWAVHQVHPSKEFVVDLLPDLRQYASLNMHRDPEVGLYSQTGHDDGMEININSRQTKDDVRGAPGYRPTLNSYMWADARAIARIGQLAGQPYVVRQYEPLAEEIKKNLQGKLWDPKREFFFPMAKNDEQKDGHVVKAGSLTYQSGKYAGNPHGRELIGYVPWQFGIPDKRFDAAWKFLMDPDYFFADYGPTTTERHDPLFLVTRTCCVWSGQSWPYATTQTLKALANVLQAGGSEWVSRADYLKLLKVYTKTHRKGGRPYIAEGANPDTGSWEGYDSYSHSEHYFHSGYNDLIITGLVGLRPRDDDTLEVNPLAPKDWPYFALDDVPYRGHRIAVVWDKVGTRYGLGQGLRVLVDGREAAASDELGTLKAKLAPGQIEESATTAVNLAVNNDGTYFPKVTTSFSHPASSATKLVDGNYWYHISPPNRWTCEGSPNESDWCAIDFGTKRRLHTIKLYILDDGATIAAPSRFELESWDGQHWAPILGQTRTPREPTGHRANVITFPEIETIKVRAVLTHRSDARSGLTEFETWGDTREPIFTAPTPSGNLALNPGRRPFPKATASFTSRFDLVEMANDGRTSFLPAPHNRWTAYESPHASDWLEIDFGEEKDVGRVELAIYDDRGGVRPPQRYDVQFWDGTAWRDVAAPKKSPAEPTGGQFNEVGFAKCRTAKVRILFEHRKDSRSGVSEVLVWPE